MGYGKQTEIANVTFTADFHPGTRRLRQVILQAADGGQILRQI